MQAQRQNQVPLNIPVCIRVIARRVWLVWLQVCCLNLEHVCCKSAATPNSPLPRTTPTASHTPAARSLRSRTTPCWTALTVKAPPTARVGCAVAILKDQLVLHGGMPCSVGAKAQLTADVFALGLTSMTWRQIGKSSSHSSNVARVNHLVVAMKSVDAILVLGGQITGQANFLLRPLLLVNYEQQQHVVHSAVIDTYLQTPGAHCSQFVCILALADACC